jgi:hypothetical protein
MPCVATGENLARYSLGNTYGYRIDPGAIVNADVEPVGLGVAERHSRMGARYPGDCSVHCMVVEGFWFEE